MTRSMLIPRDWKTEKRRALSATEIVTGLTRIEGWRLAGDGADVAIEKTYRFADYFETIAAPLKRLLWFEESAHNPPFEQPHRFVSVMTDQVLPLVK